MIESMNFKKFLSVKKLKRCLDKSIFGKLETIMASNWFNPLATFYLNVRSLPFLQALKMPIFVYGRPRFYNLSGKIVLEGGVSTGMIKFNQTSPGRPSVMGVQSEIVNQGTIIFHGPGMIGTGNKIRVTESATLEIGRDFGIADMINIGCYSRIIIGNHARITHRCQIFDANYHYVANLNNRTIPKWTRPIVIGERCWICNSSTVMAGTVLPDYTIVASNSLVNRDFSAVPQKSIIGGIPAKYLSTGYLRVFNPQTICMITEYYDNNGEGMYVYPEDVEPDTFFF